MQNDVKDLFAFLLGNMKEMEAELRAQSIVFDALAKGVITPGQMGDALVLARKSVEMRELVETKYQMTADTARRADAAPADEEAGPRTYLQ